MISFDLLLLTMLKVYGKLFFFFLLSFGTMTSGHTHGKRAGSKYGIMTPARWACLGQITLCPVATLEPVNEHKLHDLALRKTFKQI